MLDRMPCPDRSSNFVLESMKGKVPNEGNKLVEFLEGCEKCFALTLPPLYTMITMPATTEVSNYIGLYFFSKRPSINHETIRQVVLLIIRCFYHTPI